MDFKDEDIFVILFKQKAKHNKTQKSKAKQNKRKQKKLNMNVCLADNITFVEMSDFSVKFLTKEDKRHL